MAGKSKVEVVYHMSFSEVLAEIKKRKIEYDLTERLIFISDVMRGVSVPKASKNIGVSHTAGYDWLRRWNEGSIDGLIPKYGGGRPPELSKEDLKKLDKKLLKIPNLTNDKVSEIIEYEFGVEYCERHVSRILRKLDYTYTKPYMIYKKMPEDAEEQLKKNFDNQFK